MAFDWNKPFGTRDGRSARLEHKLSKPMASGETHLVEVDDNGWEFYFSDGSFEGEQCPDDLSSCWDLVNIPEKKVVERWVVVTENDGVHVFGSFFAAECQQKSFNSLGTNARIIHIREEFNR